MSRFPAEKQVITLIAAILIAVFLFAWLSFHQSTKIDSKLIFRELTEVERSIISEGNFDLFASGRVHDSEWMMDLLTTVTVRGWSNDNLARRVYKMDPKEIDLLLLTIINGSDGVLLSAAFHVLTLMGSQLPQSSAAFGNFLEERLVEELPMDKSYTGSLTVGIVSAASRLAFEGNLAMKNFLLKMRRNGIIGKVKSTEISKDFMSHVIFGFAPITPDEDTVTFLNSIKGEFKYAQTGIDLIRAYQKSGDNYQEYIFSLVFEGDPTVNKYVRYKHLDNAEMPPVRLEIIDRDASRDFVPVK